MEQNKKRNMQFIFRLFVLSVVLCFFGQSFGWPIKVYVVKNKKPQLLKSVDVNDYNTIEDVKTKLMLEFNYPVEQQIFIQQGKILKDDEQKMATLKNPEGGATVWLLCNSRNKRRS
jgi:hypothetical protein